MPSTNEQITAALATLATDRALAAAVTDPEIGPYAEAVVKELRMAAVYQAEGDDTAETRRLLAKRLREIASLLEPVS